MPKINRSARYKEVVHVLNLGAGVQSTTLYLMACEGRLKFDYAVFADTQEEPEDVYRHLEWLKGLKGPPILAGSVGSLGDDLISGKNSTGQHFVSVPAFTLNDGQKGQVRRQCTMEYKIRVCERVIRRDICRVRPGKRIRKHHVKQYFGISTDEQGRAERAKKRFEKTEWTTPHYPLLDMGMSRADCVLFLRNRVPHPVPKSSCVFCPFKTNQQWAEMKRSQPPEWGRAVQVDYAIRHHGGSKQTGEMYLHRSLIPLDLIDFDKLAPNTLDPMTVGECQGMCGL